jgi:hypothetical protein
VVEPARIEEKSLELPAKVLTEEEKAKLLERFIFISIPEMFEDLKRAPVKFYHDKHTVALEPEGCDLCHPKDEEDKFVFTYPKEKDERDKETLMNSFHDECMGCHNERAEEEKKTGPVTCGECHVIEDEYLVHEYMPILPDYYEPLRDTYHKECVACHQEPAKSAEEAGKLEWKNFYVKEQQKIESDWPEVAFDYYLHDKHDKALEEKCELCHYLSPEREEKLKAEGKEPVCQDWLWELDEKNSLTVEEAAHPRCINCHLERKEEGKEKTGPYYCRECHTGVERTVKEMTSVPRLECDQEEKILIEIEEDARTKGVPFNHKSHQENTAACQDCHHETLRACKECHTVAGSEEGEGITLAEAYHQTSSPWSCIGCHETEKKKASCAGCHHLMDGGLVESACTACHTGKLESLEAGSKLPQPEELIPDDVKEELEITVIENEYELSKMTHLAIAKKLTDLSNESKLASYFHTDPMTICAGCHHFGPLEKKTVPPQCVTCHTARKEPESAIPALLGAYHQQCLGCHKQMGEPEEKMPQSCTGCHEEKKKNGTQAK